MTDQLQRVDVLVVGAGPAGMAAACCASENGCSVALLDDNPSAGGQIWRGQSPRPSSLPDDPQANRWLQRLSAGAASLMPGARVIGLAGPQQLIVETPADSFLVQFKKLILATGARELFLPFPGWTLPNVTGAGGLQALVKSGLPIRGKRVAVAGSGPLLLAAAAYLRKKGAAVGLVAEQAPWRRLAGFAGRLAASPSKILQAAALRLRLGTVTYRTGCWPIGAKGHEKLCSVEFRQGRQRWEEPCDYLACGFGLVPNIELAAHLGCGLKRGAVAVDEMQQTTVQGVYCVGEPTGIGGLESALVEGQIAGLAASGRFDAARRLFSKRHHWQQFAQSLAQAFALRPELKGLPQPGTLVCRCEDVPFKRLQGCCGWREAKLHTRCGMGPCQGRVCGAAAEFLLGWDPVSVRPPVFPARAGTLASVSRRGAEAQKETEEGG